MSEELSRLMHHIHDENMRDVFLHTTLDQMVTKNDLEKPKRTGWHLSNIISPSEKGVHRLCYRQYVLTKFYTPAQEKQLSVKALRIFLEGWYIHLKWQHLFQASGNALEVEHTRYNKLFDLYYTPDIVAFFPEETGKEEWIVEIKSMNTERYEKAIKEKKEKNTHPSGYKQAQMYMYLTGYKHAMLLLENKNTQEHEERSFEYDEKVVQPYVKRLITLSDLSEDYKNGSELPERVCSSSDVQRAKQCPMRDVCFIERKKREQFFITEEKSETQINASLIHKKEGK
jgi:hypothetical protein